MADTDDNVFVTVGTEASGASVATDYINGDAGTTFAHHQYVKLAWGADGVAKYVDTATGKHLPVTLYVGGNQISQTSNALNTYIKGSDATLNTAIASLGITAVHVDGTTYATVPVMISGTTAIGGAIAIKGTGLSADFVYIAGFDGATAIGVTGNVVVSGTVGITTASNVSIPVTGDVSVSGSVTASGTVGVTTASGVSLPIQGVVGITTATGVSIPVSGSFTVSGLSLGTPGNSAAYTSQDGVVVQGITNAYPVFTHLGFITADGTPRYFGHSGDALKVAITDASISATVNVGTVVGVESTETYLAVSGTSSGASDANPITVQVTGGTLSGIDGTVTVSGSVSISGTPTFTATDLDIRGLTFGNLGNSGDVATTTDSIVIQGVSGAFPVGTVLYGTTNGAGGEAIALGVTWEDNTPILRTVIDSRAIIGADALQIQGRTDGSTIYPVKIAGVGPTSDVSPEEGLVGVTFDILNGLPVQGGLTAPQGSSYGTIGTVLYGLSGASMFPVGICMDGNEGALKVNIANVSGISFDVTVDSELFVGNTTGTPVAVQGACAGNVGVFVTGTGGTVAAWPIFVQGYTTGAGATWPVGVTFEYTWPSGVTEGISSAADSLVGLCAGVKAIADAIGTPASTIAAAIAGIHDQTSFTNIESNLLTVKNALANWITTDSAPEPAVKVNPPTAFFTAKRDYGSGGDALKITDISATLKSGARVKLHPEATGYVYVGSSQSNAQNAGYLLSAGDEIFIEMDNLNRIWVKSDGGTNMTVYAIGF
jgi:hypothetical protein